jgi:uncharacterized protein YneF (UPF0154 family)
MEYKMEFNLESILAIVVAVALGIFGLFIRQVAKYVRETPDLKLNILPALYPFVEEAIRWAANKVEELDKSGELEALIDPYKEKGRQKLSLAVDYAVGYIEVNVNRFLKGIGLDINLELPRDFIEDIIQRYVWENPSLFPSSKVPEVVTLQSEQKLTVPTNKHARLQPANYPANVYKAEENVETTMG